MVLNKKNEPKFIDIEKNIDEVYCTLSNIRLETSICFR